MNHKSLHKNNELAWDLAARKYEPDVQSDVALLRSGILSLAPQELLLLGDLSPWCQRAVHLQCSHGQDALSLWKLGAAEVVGIDISAAMLRLAQVKTELLGAPASWIHSDILHVPAGFDGTADLVYTGKGALPWMMDLEQWAGVVVRLLKPGGKFFVFEGHPLNWIWEPEAADFRLREDEGDYFSDQPRANRDFPASAVRRVASPDKPAPQSFERQWTLGTILTTLVKAGLHLERLEEYPDQFWPQFDAVPPEVVMKLPHTFALLMHK